MNMHIINQDIANRYSYLDINDGVIEDVKHGWLFIRNELNAILDKFYDRMGELGLDDKIPDTHDLKLRQYRHWANLFNCSFSQDYVEQVQRAGIAHRDIDLNPAYLTIGYAFILDEMTQVLERKMPDEPARLVRTIRAIHKLAALDAGIALFAYSAVVLD